jgi:hypothetical protein
MCEQATILITQVNGNVLNFDDLLKEGCNRSFQMSFPVTFKKINNSTQFTKNPANNAKQAR